MKMLAILLPMLFAAAPAFAAERNYSVTSFERVRVDGPYRVILKTGVAPFARATGPAAGLDGVAVDVQGRTLIVRPNRSSWGGFPEGQSGPVEIAIGTHEIRTAWVNGAGSLVIDRIEGLAFDLAIQGSGSVAVESAEIDQMKIGISGAGSARLAGNAAKLTAIVRGTSVLDGRGLNTKDSTIGAEGPSEVMLTVNGEAKVDARGVASVQLAGDPACTVKAHGSAVVSGCRNSGRRP